MNIDGVQNDQLRLFWCHKSTKAQYQVGKPRDVPKEIRSSSAAESRRSGICFGSNACCDCQTISATSSLPNQMHAQWFVEGHCAVYELSYVAVIDLNLFLLYCFFSPHGQHPLTSINCHNNRPIGYKYRSLITCELYHILSRVCPSKLQILFGFERSGRNAKLHQLTTFL